MVCTVTVPNRKKAQVPQSNRYGVKMFKEFICDFEFQHFISAAIWKPDTCAVKVQMVKVLKLNISLCGKCIDNILQKTFVCQ